jgi:hypothetical protein
MATILRTMDVSIFAAEYRAMGPRCDVERSLRIDPQNDGEQILKHPGLDQQERAFHQGRCPRPD